jgi:hypothetical protein
MIFLTSNSRFSNILGGEGRVQVEAEWEEALQKQQVVVLHRRM